ncbi:MAG: aminotransferase class V-fold PLP-dependent enzyme [Acidobacteria bacterium]|nr:aminotransferase class V-fold PLP-dependent enzyme [Acidobacteriota bacterium]
MRRRSFFTGLTALPAAALAAENPEAYWKRIRDEQFYLPAWRAFLNNGSLGVAPKPVVAAVERYLEKSATLDMDEYPRWGYEKMEAHRTALAEYIGCPVAELALTHNATEAMGIVASGLDLKAGDEVLMTDQEHPSGRGAWLVRQARHGIQVRMVPLPLPPKDPGQIADLLIGSIGPRTRVLSFSGITTTTGMVLPVKEICRAARAKGVITLVDGAHMHGQIPFRVADMECDFMAGSPHKWLFAPAGCGLLYARKEMQERIWPSITTDGWTNQSLEGARFMQVGTNNRAILEGMVAGLEFGKGIGPDRIYTRIHQLARMVFDRARRMPGVKMLTPDDDRMFGSLVTMQLQPAHAQKFAALCKERRIWISGAERFRVSTHIHTRPEDIDLLLRTMTESL